MGGYDTNGRPGLSGASQKEILNEVRRCCREYGKYNSYIFLGFILINFNDLKGSKSRLKPMLAESRILSREYAAAKIKSNPSAASVN